MPSSLSILPDGGRVRTFTCPVCGETIALGCERCRFCSVVINQSQAVSAADLMDRVNLACSEADEIRALLGNEPADWDITADRRGRIDIYLIPFLLLRWWVRFGSLRANDTDLKAARKDMKLYSWIGLTVLAIVVGLAIYSIGHK